QRRSWTPPREEQQCIEIESEMGSTEARRTHPRPRVAFSILRQAVWATDIASALYCAPDCAAVLHCLMKAVSCVSCRPLALACCRHFCAWARSGRALAKQSWTACLRAGPVSPCALAWAWHCARACLPAGLALGEPVAGDAAAGAPAAGAPAAGGGAGSGVVVCAFAGANARPTPNAAMRRRFMGGVFLDLVLRPPAG